MSGLEETARNHYQNGEYAQALSAWLELSQNFPGRDDYLVSSGNCFDALGDQKGRCPDIISRRIRSTKSHCRR